MELVEFMNYLKQVLRPQDFVAIGMVYLLTHWIKGALPKVDLYRRMLVIVIGGAVAGMVLLASKAPEGILSGHITAYEVPFYAAMYAAFAIGARFFVNKWKKKKG